MAMIEGFSITNYRVLKKLEMGWLSLLNDQKPLTPLTAIIGKNGTGKSTLFDAFGFMVDALSFGVEEACHLHDRGGFDRIVSTGSNNKICFNIFYRESSNDPPIQYRITINRDDNGRPFIRDEALLFFHSNDNEDHINTLNVQNGKGTVIRGKISVASPHFKPENVVKFNLDDTRKLALSSLGLLKEYPDVVAFYNFLSRWHLNYFVPDLARKTPLAGAQPHLSPYGDNLANVVQFMERKYQKRFKSLLNNVAKKIPGLERIDTKKMDDGKLLLRFYNKGFKDPFFPQEVSDGTLKLLALLLLINDPDPPPLIGIEEPENYLYHKLLNPLIREFRKRATGKKNAPQILLTTHQPYLVDELSPEEVWILEKGADGFATIRRASDDQIVKAMVEEEIPLGSLWYSGYLEPRKS